MRHLRFILLVAAIPGFASNAMAHHEAVFGPQSALLAGDRVFSAQVFTRQTGPENERVQETTTVLSGAMTPTRLPVSFSVVMPFSVINAGTHGGTRVGLENVVVAARYRVDLPALTRAFGSDCYALGVGGVELPTGTIDHHFGDGPAAGIVAGSLGLERRPFSLIAYGLLHRYTVHEQVRESGTRFLGAGFAWTPIDEEQQGHLLSLQFGVSHETTFREVLNGMPLDNTGGRAVVAHPTVVFAASPRALVFIVGSVPMADRWNNPSDRERFRVGAGTTVHF